MLEIEPILHHGVSIVIVAFRLAGLLMFSPMLAGAAIPSRAKIFLVVTLAAAIYPALGDGWQEPAALNLVTLAQVMFTEMLIGSAIGLVASIPIVAVQVGGTIMGQQMGLGLAQVFNPEIGTNSGVVDQLLFYTALAVFISMGGIEAMFMSLMNSYGNVPLGAMAVASVPLELLVGTLSSGYELAMRVAAPVLAIMFIETVASGVLMKTIPQINIMSVGFAIKTLAGLLAFTAAVGSIFTVFADEAAEVLTVLLDWSSTLTTGGIV